MSDIARLGVVVEQSGIETTLKGLDAIAAKMKAIETSKVSPVSTPKGGSTATAALAKEEFKLTAFKEKEAEKRLTAAEKSAAKERDIALKTNSAKEAIEARTAAYKKVLADKAESEAIKHNQQMAFIHKRSQDGILRIEEKTKADILKIREKADSELLKQSSKLNNDLVRMSTAQSLRIAEQEAKNTSNLSAISQKELEKRITEQTRATARIETEKAKSATRIEQIEAANQAKIQQIRERTAAYAEKLQMREELAVRRSIEQQSKAYSSLADIANKARNVMAVAFAGYGITEAVGAVIKTADAMTELNARLRLVTQSSAELKQVQMDLFRVSQSSGTSIKDNSEIYFGLARATKALGTSQKELISLTEGLGKAAIVSGASTQSFKAAMFQLRQALESGVLRGQEFNSISEQAPRVLQAIGEGLGKTTGELRKMAGEGQLTTDVVLPALMKGLQSVNKEFDSLPTTVSRATTMVENSFSMLVARANEASKGTSTLAEVIKSVSSAMDSISTDNITTAMNAAGVAVTGLALVLSGKLIQALGAASVAKVASIKADMEMVRSNATVAASELQKAQAASVAAAEKARAAAMEVEAANAAVAAAERVVLAEEASRMSMLKTLAAREALTVAQAKAAAASQASVAATTAMTASNNAAATAADAHAVAQERLSAAGTATGRVMSGLGAVFNAMGGWVTVAIGVIWGLVTVWDNVANAAENAARKQKEAVMRGKASENIAGVTKEETEALLKVEKATVNAKKLETYLNELERSGKSKTDNEVKTVQSLLDKERAAITGWRSAATQLENERKSKTAALQSTIANNIQDENAGYEKIVKNYQDSVKFKSDKQRQMDDLKEVDRQADDALSKLHKKPSVEDVRLGTYNSDKVAKAAAEIERTRSEQRKLVMEKYAKKGGGAKKPKAPELSAGYEAALSYTQEQLEVINKMASAQEKLLGYIKPELLERKQSLEAEKEKENTVAKIAKIQEQLNKKNLGKGVAGQLQEQLKIYQQQKDAISQELVVTQALQREQNNLKIYEMDVLRIAQQKNELQKAYLDAAVSTGSLSGQEAKQQEQLNALKMIEIEYAGKIIEAQKTYDLMVKNRYTEEAEASKLRLDSLISERDTKLEVAKIKMYSDQEAKTFEAGWRRAWGTYKDEASNASSFSEKVMGDTLNGIEDAFYAMMSGVEFSFKDLWKSILSDMNRYFAKQLTNTIADAIIGGFRTPLDAGFSVNVSGGQGQGVSQQVIGASSNGYDVLDIFSNSKSSYDATINKALTSNIGQSLGFSTPLTYTDAWAVGQNVSGATVSAGAELTSLGQAASTASQALGYIPSVMQATEGKYLSAAGSAVGQYFGGPIGSMAGAAIGGLLDDAFGFGDKKPDERKAKFGYGASDALVAEGKQTGWTGSSVFGDFRTYNDKWFSDSEMRPAMSAYIDSLENLDNYVADTLKLTADQTTNAIDALKAIDKEYSFGMQWGDFTENSKAREQIAIDRYATILDSVEQGWGDFVRDFTGSFDEFPAYLQSIVEAMQQFSDAGSDVTRVFGEQINSIKEFERFAKSGETSAAAFQRLYGIFQITNRVLESLGRSAEGANLATADLRESFVRLAGGMEQLQGYISEYYNGFYTEAERTAVVMTDLQKEFDKYGATVPATREEWRKLMESLDLSTQAGQEAAVKMYQLQGAFLSVTESIDDVHAKQKQAADDAKRAADQAREDALRAQQEAEDAARQAVEDARRQVEEAYNREADAIRSTIDRLEDFTKQIRKFRDDLYLDQNLSPLSKYDQYMYARSKFDDVRNRAMAGDPEALEQLEQSSRDFLEYSRAYNANNGQYQQDFDLVQSVLDSTESIAVQQLNTAKAQLDALNQMVSGILQVNDSVMSLSEAIANYNAALMALQNVKAGAAGGGAGKVGNGSVKDSNYWNNYSNTNTEDYWEKMRAAQNFYSLYRDSDFGTTNMFTATNGGLVAGGKSQVKLPNQSELDAAIKALQAEGLSVEDVAGLIDRDAKFVNQIVSDFANQGLNAGFSQPSIYNGGGQASTVIGQADNYQYTPPTTPQVVTTPSPTLPSPTAPSQTVPSQTVPSQTDITAYVNANRNDQMAIYNAAIANGVSSAQLAAASGWSQAEISAWASANGLSQFANGGFANDGMALVGESGPEVVNIGQSRVFTHQQMKQMLNPANEDGYGKREMIQELKRVNAMLDSLKKEVAAQSQIDRQQRGEIASRQEVIQKQQIVSSIRASANSV